MTRSTPWARARANSSVPGRPTARTAVAGRSAMVAGVIAFSMVATIAPAVATPFTSAEVGGTNAAARTAASDLRTPWVDAVTAQGLTVPPPALLTAAVGDVISGPIVTTAAGTVLSVERARYSTDALAPVFLEMSPNQPTAVCPSNGRRLQAQSPRPTMVLGNAGCTNGNGTVYATQGGAREQRTRDAVEFTFDRPVAAFGAWFGDLETRTDGSGVPAIVRVYDAAGDLHDEWNVVPSTADQSLCGGRFRGCGNNTTMWIGYSGEPISRMVVIVGDDDATGTSLREGFSFIGPTVVDVEPALSVTSPGVPVAVETAGDFVAFSFVVTNAGPVAVQLDASSGCSEPTLLEPADSTNCSVTQVVTQEQLNAGSIDVPVVVSGEWRGLVVEESTTITVPLVQTRQFSLAMSTDVTEVDLIGDSIAVSVVVTNDGNTSTWPVAVRIDGVAVDCLPLDSIAPDGVITCTSTVIVTVAGDRTVLAEVEWMHEGAPVTQSASMVVPWTAVTVTPTPPAPTPAPPTSPSPPAVGQGSSAAVPIVTTTPQPIETPSADDAGRDENAGNDDAGDGTEVADIQLPDLSLPETASEPVDAWAWLIPALLIALALAALIGGGVLLVARRR